MPTIDELAPATAASDTDEIPVSQSGFARKLTRAQLLAGVQPQIALPTKTLLGRTSSDTGAPEVISIGANLVLSAGILTAAAEPYLVALLPAGTVPSAGDLVPLGQTSTNTAIPYAQFMAGLSGLSGLDASELLVTPTAAAVSQTLADIAGGAATGLSLAAIALPKSGGTMTGPVTLAADPLTPMQAATKQYTDALSILAPKKSANLSDLENPSTARTNLGLGSISTQSNSSVAITGGTISGITTLSVPGTISTSSNAVLNGADLVVNGNNHGVFLKNSSSGYSRLSSSGPNIVLFGASGSPIWSFDNSIGAGSPFFVQAPLQALWIKSGTPTYVLAGASPVAGASQCLDIGVNYRGSLGSTEPNANTIYVASDTLNSDNVPINLAALKINYQYGGIGTTGGRTGLRIVINPIGTVGGGNPFQVGSEIFSTSNLSFGGTDLGAGARGQIVPINTVGRAYSGATNLVVVSGLGEINMSVDAGASAAILNGFQISRLSTDAGTVAKFRAMMFAGTQTPTGATNTIPDMDYGIVWGHDHHQWSFGANSRMIGWIGQAPGSNAGNAPIYPSKLGWGVDLWGVNIINQAWRSTGFQIDGAGSVTIGTTRIGPSPQGLTIDASGQFVSFATVNAGGTGYQIGEYLYGSVGDIYAVAGLSGTRVSAVTIVTVGYASTPPANPVAVTGGSGLGATLNLAWTAGNGVVIGGPGQKIGFYGAGPIAKPSITGSRGGNAALASIITALSAYGLITDSTIT